MGGTDSISKAGAGAQEPRMRRIPPVRIEDLPKIHLYLDDLMDIEAVFRGVCKTVKVQAANYEFASVSDLPLLERPQVNEVEINGTDPYCYFEIRPYLARVIVSNTDDVRQVGLATKVREIVEKRKTKVGKPYLVSLVRSTDAAATDPAAPAPLTWLGRNRDFAVAVAGAVAGAIATALMMVLLVLMGILKTA
jgi:hypothetical protein